MIDRQTSAGARWTDFKATAATTSIGADVIATRAVDAADTWLFTTFVNI